MVAALDVTMQAAFTVFTDWFRYTDGYGRRYTRPNALGEEHGAVDPVQVGNDCDGDSYGEGITDFENAPNSACQDNTCPSTRFYLLFPAQVRRKIPWVKVFTG
ncbi:uncharacterized protein BP5553_07123 [Venustampulla echinocandica]|uniref:Uncharacterized protein n=1 Tax=Venustampulla echinocandica TaxID=2656787 RepID=A0A370TIK7_9HELO|nr:uncharacterized protein BP5553_07123 [Venustampulla echinocandica]RDL35192.1 hypothetical protein BP5553_07123 [Venustampulla echinocandica]